MLLERAVNSLNYSCINAQKQRDSLRIMSRGDSRGRDARFALSRAHRLMRLHSMIKCASLCSSDCSEQTADVLRVTMVSVAPAQIK